MCRQLIYTFYVEGMDTKSIAANVFIKGLPPNATATVFSTVEYVCDWYILYSVISGDGQTEFFYEQVQDSNESYDYVLNISYGSTRAICSFDSSEQIIFVNSNNEMFLQQNQQMFYEYIVNENFKLFLVIFKNNILLFWHNDSAQVVVKTLNFSTFIELYLYQFTRVDHEIDLTNEHCKITFYTDPLDTNIYYSAYFDIKSFLQGNDASVVLKKHIVNQPSYSPFNGSQFTTDICKQMSEFTLKMSHIVDRQLLEADSEADSEADIDDSDAGSDADSEEDDY